MSGRATLRWVVACSLVSVGVAGFTGLSNDPIHLISVVFVQVLGLIGAAIGAWKYRRELRLAGTLIVAALASWCIGAVGWDLNVLVFDSEPFPSWTDGFFLLSYPLLMWAGLLMVRRREVRRDAAALIDAAIVTVGVGIVAYVFIIYDASIDTEMSALGRVIGVLYPLCDVLVVGVVARLFLGAAAKSRAGLLLVSALGCLLIADITFAVAVFDEEAAAYDYWIDAPYMMCFVLIALALHQSDVARLVHGHPSGIERLGRVRIAVLTAGALLAPLTLLLSPVVDVSSKVRGAAIGAAVVFLLVIARMSLLMRVVERNSDLLLVQARTDGLTGLPNRRTFDFELARTVVLTGTDDKSEALSVAMIDLDRFKAYNDTFGHGAGDRLLQRAAIEWRQALIMLAPEAVLARYGGEEFALILPGMDEELAATVLRELLHLTPESQTFSAGVAQWNPDEPPEAVLRRADLRLYQAKATGRARVVVDEELVDHPLAAGPVKAAD